MYKAVVKLLANWVNKNQGIRPKIKIQEVQSWQENH